MTMKTAVKVKNADAIVAGSKAKIQMAEANLTKSHVVTETANVMMLLVTSLLKANHSKAKVSRSKNVQRTVQTDLLVRIVAKAAIGTKNVSSMVIARRAEIVPITVVSVLHVQSAAKSLLLRQRNAQSVAITGKTVINHAK